MATYDPNKSYTWGPDTKFVLSGQDFSLMLHAFRGILSTKEATNTILAYEMNKKIEEIMATAVAEGKVVETIPPSDGVENNYEKELPVAKLKPQLKKVKNEA
jgi:hypothetical protein